MKKGIYTAITMGEVRKNDSSENKTLEMALRILTNVENVSKVSIY